MIVTIDHQGIMPVILITIETMIDRTMIEDMIEHMIGITIEEGTTEATNETADLPPNLAMIPMHVPVHLTSLVYWNDKSTKSAIDQHLQHPNVF